MHRLSSEQVKRQLLEQAAKVEASEIRRKQRDAKKYGKALQTERRLEKEKRKHDDLAEIAKWRKNKPAGENDRSGSLPQPRLALALAG